MDIPRPSQAKARLRRRILWSAGAVLGIAAITIFLSRLEPAAPSVDHREIWPDTVKRGPMVREVRGIGTLVPEEIRWIGARTSGRVERILLRPGAIVEPDSILVELINPDVLQTAAAAESQLVAAEAELSNLRITLQSNLLQMEAGLARARSTEANARLTYEVNEKLFADGLVSDLELRRSRVAADDAAVAYEIEKKRYEFAKATIDPQISVKESEVVRVRAIADLRRQEQNALKVRAGVHGVLQQLPLEVGQQVAAGTNLARVADPARLKAEVRVPETQAKDITIGQRATVDTRSGGANSVVEGRVSRIDPAVQNGTVTVDITLEGELPRGARPDLSVDGVIELERLDDVVYVSRPAFGQENSTAGIYKISPDGDRAERVQVKFGRASVNSIEILGGLAPGDRVILSDMSQWEEHDRLRLR